MSQSFVSGRAVVSRERAVAAHLLRYLAEAQRRGRGVRLDELADAIDAPRAEVRRVAGKLHREGHIDARRMRLTMTGFTLAAAMRDAELPDLTFAKNEPSHAERARQATRRVA